MTMSLNLRVTGNIFSYAEPVDASPFRDWCRRNWPGRAATCVHEAFAATRAEILLGGGLVHLVAADFSSCSLRVCRNGDAGVVNLGCGNVSSRILRHLEWCLNREAALAAARRLNSLAARAARASDTGRVSMYEDIFSAAFCLWSALRAAWDNEYAEDDDHPSDLPATAFQWRALTMAHLASPAAARLVHEAAASIHGLPAPAGGFDAGYGLSNLDYLFTEWEASEDAELREGEAAALRQWAYRIYAPFGGPAPEGIEFPWHCAASASHPQDAEPRFEDCDIPSAPVRGRAVRLA